MTQPKIEMEFNLETGHLHLKTNIPNAYFKAFAQLAIETLRDEIKLVNADKKQSDENSTQQPELPISN